MPPEGIPMHLYERVPAATDERRSFSVKCGLVPGYDASTKRFKPRHARQILRQWMARRAARQQPFLTGIMTAGRILYAWEADGRTESRAEHGVTFSGEVSVIYSAEMTDDEAVAVLEDLAEQLGKALGQTRVYLTYRDKAWVIQAKGRTSPRLRWE